MSEDGYRLLRSFAMKEEADVAASALVAYGIPAIVGNANAATLDWTLIPALGGVQVLVPARQHTEALQVLNLGDDADTSPSFHVRRRDHWKAKLLLLWVLGPIVVAFVIETWWRAMDVAHEFQNFGP